MCQLGISYQDFQASLGYSSIYLLFHLLMFVFACFTDDSEKIRRCITAGFFANAARLHYSGEYRTVRDDYPLHIHPTSVLYTEKRKQWYVLHLILSFLQGEARLPRKTL